MLFSATSIAVLGFASYASAHMKMAKPVPYANAQLDNAPLDGKGSNFPCKMLFDTTTPATSMALGSTQPLEFTGGATHGGGSCQVSITYDNPPNKNSVFKVIHSIEGGCPTKNNAGNIGTDASSSDPDTYSFTIPTNLPTGKATLAWTWFNKVGNREMYMNCAPIDITGGSSKRSELEDDLVANITQLMERDQSAYNALPNMFTANILNIGTDSCVTKETVDVLFPNPGTSVDQPGKQSNLQPPPPGCGDSSSQASQAAGSGATATATAGNTASTSNAPGVFATIPVSSAAAATAVATSTKAPTAASSAAPVASPSSSPASSSSSGTTGAMTAGSACSPEGVWNCVGGTSFQQCASGTWSVVQSLAAGTKCTPGQSTNINITASKEKRAIRFSSEHVRRHLQKST
jgi:hypothetical protein